MTSIAIGSPAKGKKECFRQFDSYLFHHNSLANAVESCNQKRSKLRPTRDYLWVRENVRNSVDGSWPLRHRSTVDRELLPTKQQSLDHSKERPLSYLALGNKTRSSAKGTGPGEERTRQAIQCRRPLLSLVPNTTTNVSLW